MEAFNMTAIPSLSQKETRELVLKGLVTPDGTWFHYYLKEFVIAKNSTIDTKDRCFMRDRHIM